MITRRQVIQIAGLFPLGSKSTPVRATEFFMPFDLQLLQPIAHSLFGDLPLTQSSRFQVDYDYYSLTRNNDIPKRPVDNRGVAISMPESGYVVPIVIRDIFTAKVALVLEKSYHDPKIVAIFQFREKNVIQLSTRVNLQGFSSAFTTPNRVWALTEAHGQILWSYVNIDHRIACDGC